MALCYECQSLQGMGTLDSIKRATFDSAVAKEWHCGACCRLLVAVMQVLELTVSYAMHTGTKTTEATSPTANSYIYCYSAVNCRRSVLQMLQLVLQSVGYCYASQSSSNRRDGCKKDRCLVSHSAVVERRPLSSTPVPE
jgi:hypothetical protein